MKIFKCGTKELPYEIIPTANKKQFYTSFKQDNLLCIYAPTCATDKDIKLMLRQQFWNYYFKLYPEEKKVYVHFLGELYLVEKVKAKKDSVNLNEKKKVITIYATKNSLSAYQSLLRNFYKRQVEKSLVELWHDIEWDFRDITLPTFTVKGIRGFLGYNYANGKVVISPKIAAYEPVYIKLLFYHEITHSIVYGHKQEFWNELEKRHPGAIELTKKMKKLTYKYTI